MSMYLGCIVSLGRSSNLFHLPSFVEDGVRNEEHNQQSRNTVLYKFGVSILNIWPRTSRNRPSMHTERYKPILMLLQTSKSKHYRILQKQFTGVRLSLELVTSDGCQEVCQFIILSFPPVCCFICKAEQFNSLLV